MTCRPSSTQLTRTELGRNQDNQDQNTPFCKDGTRTNQDVSNHLLHKHDTSSYPKIRTRSLEANISAPGDPIEEISFRLYSPRQGLSNKLETARIQSLHPEIFATKVRIQICPVFFQLSSSSTLVPCQLHDTTTTLTGRQAGSQITCPKDQPEL